MAFIRYRELENKLGPPIGFVPELPAIEGEQEFKPALCDQHGLAVLAVLFAQRQNDRLGGIMERDFRALAEKNVVRLVLDRFKELGIVFHEKEG